MMSVRMLIPIFLYASAGGVSSLLLAQVVRRSAIGREAARLEVQPRTSRGRLD